MINKYLSNNLLVVTSLSILFGAYGFYEFGGAIGKALSLEPGDDWTNYHLFATAISQGDFWLKIYERPYTVPAGFGYIYWLALLYAVFGNSYAVVYIIQSVLLGASAGFFYAAFRRNLTSFGCLILFIALVGFSVLDVLRHYTPRLLSENLFIFEVSLFFWMLQRGFVDGKRWCRLGILAVLGCMFLTRPNVLPFAAVFLPWIAYTKYYKKEYPWWELLTSTGLLLLVVNFMALRNYIVADQWLMFPPITISRAVPASFPIFTKFMDEPLEILHRLGLRILFGFGFLPLLVEKYQFRPHWWLMWAGFFGVLGMKLYLRRGFTFIEKTLFAYVLLMFIPIVLFSYISNYGFRFLVPVVIPGICAAVGFFEQKNPAETKTA